MTVEDVWYGNTASGRAASTVLAPAAWIYGAITATRNAMYERGVLRSYPSSIPVVSVGNVTVGGTGKTPVSALLVAMLRDAGHVPAVVMRGYGDDERHLHSRMNPGVAVVATSDRVAGIHEAVSVGADVVVLDDGFQHRRARRDLDIALVSAERWHRGLRLLPAGPLRESVTALRRADIVMITTKVARGDEVAALRRDLEELQIPSESIVVAEIAPTGLTAVQSDATMELSALAGASTLAVAGIGDPGSFFGQLRAAGARVTERRFRDHHDYTSAEALELSEESTGHKYVVITEKDAVKLAGCWPANGAQLWYLSQAVRLTEGSSSVASALAKLFKRATSIAG